MTEATVTTKLTNAELQTLVLQLQAQVAELSTKLVSKKAAQTTGKEMTDDDARNVLTGECSTMKHKDAADKLGLSYGQVYSCRLEFTFKAIHAEMAKAGVKNIWSK